MSISSTDLLPAFDDFRANLRGTVSDDRRVGRRAAVSRAGGSALAGRGSMRPLTGPRTAVEVDAVAPSAAYPSAVYPSAVYPSAVDPALLEVPVRGRWMTPMGGAVAQPIGASAWPVAIAPDRAGNPDHVGRPDHAGRPDHVGRPDHAGRPDHVGRPDHAGSPDRVGSPDHAGSPDRAGNPDRVGSRALAGLDGDSARAVRRVVVLRRRTDAARGVSATGARALGAAVDGAAPVAGSAVAGSAVAAAVVAPVVAPVVASAVLPTATIAAAFPTGTYVDFKRERALALGHYIFALAVFGATFLV